MAQRGIGIRETESVLMTSKVEGRAPSPCQFFRPLRFPFWTREIVTLRFYTDGSVCTRILITNRGKKGETEAFQRG